MKAFRSPHGWAVELIDAENAIKAAVLLERQRCAQACYTRADHWKDNAAKAAKLCGDAIMAGKQT